MKVKSRKKYSLATIADELDTSKSAVSFVLNGMARDRRISPTLEKRIMDFCNKVGYRPNIHAQRMNSQHVKNIGILIDKAITRDKASPFHEYNVSRVIGGISEAAYATGYGFGFQFHTDNMRKEGIFEWFKTKEIDGLIYYGFDMPDDWNQAFERENFKIVGISIDPAGGIPCVNVDNYEASLKLTQHFITDGHQKFLYLGGTPASYPANERYRGFRDALRKENIKFSEKNFFMSGFNRGIAEDYVRDRWVHDNLDIDIIMCANDNMAIGAITALSKAGIKIPKQIAVAGADNIELGQFITPSLTTFDYQPFEQGRAAFKLLHDIMMECPNPQNIVLKTTLSLRKSG